MVNDGNKIYKSNENKNELNTGKREQPQRTEPEKNCFAEEQRADENE